MSSRQHLHTDIGSDIGTVSARALWKELKTLERAITQGNETVLQHFLDTSDEGSVDAIGTIADRYNDLRLSFLGILQQHSPVSLALQTHLDPELLRERIPRAANESICAEIQSIDADLHQLLTRIGALTPPSSPSPSPPKIS